VRFTGSSESDVRQRLRDRWALARGKDWFEPTEAHSFVQVLRKQPIPRITIFAEEPHTIVLQPRVVQAILQGLLFDTNKNFLLPTAMNGMRFVKSLYDENPETDILIVGHTDTTGQPSYNDPLSLERAEAMLAFVTDDVEAWLARYDPSVSFEKRWGKHEDALMIETVAAENGEVIPLGKPIVAFYQKTRGLKVDNIAGPETRRTLIAEYMSIDGTTRRKVRAPSRTAAVRIFPSCRRVTTLRSNRTGARRSTSSRTRSRTRTRPSRSCPNHLPRSLYQDRSNSPSGCAAQRRRTTTLPSR
jgi:hypothetical protein